MRRTLTLGQLFAGATIAIAVVVVAAFVLFVRSSRASILTTAQHQQKLVADRVEARVVRELGRAQRVLEDVERAVRAGAVAVDEPLPLEAALFTSMIDDVDLEEVTFTKDRVTSVDWVTVPARRHGAGSDDAPDVRGRSGRGPARHAGLERSALVRARPRGAGARTTRRGQRAEGHRGRRRTLPRRRARRPRDEQARCDRPGSIHPRPGRGRGAHRAPGHGTEARRAASGSPHRPVRSHRHPRRRDPHGLRSTAAGDPGPPP